MHNKIFPYVLSPQVLSLSVKDHPLLFFCTIRTSHHADRTLPPKKNLVEEIHAVSMRFLIKLAGRHWRLEVIWRIRDPVSLCICIPGFVTLIDLSLRHSICILRACVVGELYFTLLLSYCMIIRGEMDEDFCMIIQTGIDFVIFGWDIISFLLSKCIHWLITLTENNYYPRHFPKTHCYYRTEVAKT